MVPMLDRQTVQNFLLVNLMMKKEEQVLSKVVHVRLGVIPMLARQVVMNALLDHFLMMNDRNVIHVDWEALNQIKKKHAHLVQLDSTAPKPRHHRAMVVHLVCMEPKKAKRPMLIVNTAVRGSIKIKRPDFRSARNAALVK